MRAMCGAVLTAASAIGLGFQAIALGTRYVDYPYRDAEGRALWVMFRELDTAMIVTFTALLLALLAGLAVTFWGLAEHQRRRNLEMLRDYGFIEVPTLFGPPVRYIPVPPVR